MIEILRHTELASYQDAWEFQKAAQQALIKRAGPERLIICEHPPTITLGTSFDPKSLKASRELLAAEGVQIYQTERGGDVTYHGPGQLTLYPVLDLRTRKQDIGWYMRNLEECILRTLTDYSVEGGRSNRNPGVWVGDKKIASCGVKLSRWCTMHGVAVNVTKRALAGFRHMHPCGLSGVEMSSMENECGDTVNIESVKNALILHFLSIFGERNEYASVET